MKKRTREIICVMIVICMMITSFSVINATNEVIGSNDTKIMELLDLLQEDEEERLSEKYLNTKITRFEVAVLSLRLKGLYDRAIDFRSHDNFKDVKNIDCKHGENILAYIKSNPQLGWKGIGDNKFNPNGLITAKSFYKVLLEILGYEQGKDFTWNNVFEFAKEKGMFKITDITEITNKHIAIGTVEALQANTKKGKKLINVLVEDVHTVLEKNAYRTGIYIPTDFKLESARALDANTLLMKFNKIVNLKGQDIKVFDSDNKEISIISMNLADEGKTVILTVPELKLDNEYKVKYNNFEKIVIPKVKVNKIEPKIESARAITSRKVEVIMNTNNINKDTLIASNFNIDNDCDITDMKIDYVKMKKNESKTVIILTVNRLRGGEPFTITSSKITSYKGKVGSSKITFAGIDVDVTAPKIKSVIPEGGYLVRVNFDEDNTLDEISAMDIENYEITPKLNIKKVKIDKNVKGTARKNDELSEEKNVVVLTTEDQIPGVTYTLKVKNLSDGIYTLKEDMATFIGEEKAKNQVVRRVLARSHEIVEVDFKYEANDTALDIYNYCVDGAVIKNALFIEDENGNVDRKRVMLIVSGLKKDIDYTLAIQPSIQDILGQELEEYEEFQFRSIGKIKYFTLKAIDRTSLKVQNIIDVKNVLNMTNLRCNAYSQYGSIEGNISVGISPDEENVIMKFRDGLDSNTTYTIEITRLRKVFDTIETTTTITFTTPKMNEW
ncbi:MAG: hypothetical protein N4A63_16445 [Vallitalea sp.]|jgi:hypothetical protein|nr:hypothetical protein [Vallitalea sp.]